MDKLLTLKTVLLYKRLQKKYPCSDNFESNLLSKCEKQYIPFGHQNMVYKRKNELQLLFSSQKILFSYLPQKNVIRGYDCLRIMARPLHNLTLLCLHPMYLGLYKKCCHCYGRVNLINTLTVEDSRNTLTLVFLGGDERGSCVLISSWLILAWVHKLMFFFFQKTQMFVNVLQCLEHAEREFGDTIWNYVYSAIRTAGPVYTKFIHRVTCRLHMLPKWMRLRCEKLQTNVPPHAYAYSVALVKRALKKNGIGCHVWIDPVPLGTGCVAQVHRGILKNETGFHIVAVKVLHPDIQKQLDRDLKIIRAIGYVLHLIPGSPFISLKQAIDKFSLEMYHQTNLQIEGKNTQMFHSKLGDMRLRNSSGRVTCNVKVPEIFEKYCTESVLFETYEDGMPLGEFIRLCCDSGDFKKSENKIKQFNVSKEVTNSFISQKSINDTNQRDYVLKNKKATSRKLYETASFLLRVIQDVLKEKLRNQLNACKECFGQIPFKYGFFPESENIKNDFTSIYFRKALTEMGFHLFLTMVFQHRLIHADMHPENILIRFPTLDKKDHTVSNSSLNIEKLLQRVRSIYTQDVRLCQNQLQKLLPLPSRNSEDSSTKKSLIWKSFYSPIVPHNVDLEIVLIDFGHITMLSETNYANIKDLLFSMCLQDGYNIGRLLIDRSECTTCTNRHDFCQSIEDLLNDYFTSRRGSITLRNIELGKFFFKILRIATKYRVQLDSSFLSLTLAALLVENVGKQLYPDISIIPTLFPYVAQTTLNQLKILS
ncbi:uncharacterized protein LOC128884011 isoform X2 [Hylaeus volcanicus]|uniref:uncharacterized protein LOC128884011 isoform X2 n=1 Tax=Hylaeus volcanicus TaxID=313075 RepID=UPI0023B7EE31|nr:uncharacterized protein LOC128884011 isoform X2 [Hylaeus volcanicus]